jgi:predicted DNA-binding transcriptional regulator YafY
MATQSYNKLKRLFIIISHLRHKNSTREELLRLLETHDIRIELATFERDKRTLKYDFGIELIYEASTKTYQLDEMDHQHVAQLIQFLQFNQISKTLQESFENQKKTLDYVDFENENQLQGIEFLDRLLMATQHHQFIYFEHQGFSNSHPILYVVKPYLLKQYQSRWYVVGETPINSKEQIRIFGIDRMLNLRVSEDKFKPNPINLKDEFLGHIGVSQFEKEKDIVHLKFDKSQKPYLEHLPLHSSQKFISETDKTVIYEYYLVDNFELRQHILKYGSLVKVLEPLSLANQIKKELKIAFEAY